jgi:tetratricopeptide (TPR) repeat protein
VLIAGEPGIGKTALAEDAAARATDAGATVLWGSCWEGEGAPAFWPWVQIIRSYAAGRPTSQLYAELGDGVADVARLVPEVSGRFLSLTPDADTDPDQARFRLFDHITRFLRTAAETQPMCLVLDDLHWADRSSLMLLGFFSRALRDARVLVVGTYRDVELGGDSALADLTGERITLHGLAKDDVAALIRNTTGAEPDPHLADAVFGRTTGNPFFVKEVARLLDSQGRLEASSAAAAIPEGVRDVVRRRVARLGQETAAVLGAASVIGTEFGIDLLGGMTKVPLEALLSTLDEAIRARLVAEVLDAVGRYRFAHALVREVLYEDLGVVRRASLHWVAGELLDTRDAGDEHLPEIANHLVKGAAGGDASKAADAAVRAARLAIRMYAWDQAASLYQRSLDALALTGTADARRVKTMLELGDAQTRAGDLAAARGVYEQAAELAAGLGLASELAHAALGIGGGLTGLEVPLFDDRQIEWLHRALDQLPADDSAVRAWVLARLSVASSFVLSMDERAALSRDAISMARRLGDRGALSYALSSLCDALSGPDHVAERLAVSTEMIDLATQPAAGAARCGVESCAVCLCDPEFALLGLRLRIVASLETGDIDSVNRDIDAYARLAEHLRQPLYLWYVPLFKGMRAMLRGKLDDAEGYLDEATAIALRTSGGHAALLTGVQRFGLGLEREDMGLAESAWRALYVAAPELANAPAAGGSAALIAGMFGDPARATPVLRAWMNRGGLAEQVRDSQWLASGALATECALRAGDTQSAEHVYDALAPYERLFVVGGIAAHFMGSVAHYLGRLAAFLGRDEDAERHFANAAAAHQATGATLWAERTRESRRRIGKPAFHAPEGDSVFRREGEYWTVAFDGAVARLKDSKGLRDIATLLASPGREFAALDLAAPPGGAASAGGDAGEILDDRARAEYKARIAELQSEIDDDPVRAEAAQEELDALVAQLAGAYGLGGRARKTGDPAERARKAVTERIRDAIAKLAREHPALHRHLKASIRTGTFCSYAPEHRVTWSF